MNITFDDNLITGNKTIDSQHQELIDRIRQFVAACESGDSKIKAIKMLDYLDEYTDRKSTRLNSSHIQKSRMPSSA